MRTGLGLTAVALIMVLALTSTGAQATGGGRIATACSNETVNGGKYVEVPELRGELTLRFVLIGSVTCDEAHRLVRAYFRKVAAGAGQCGKQNSFCELQFAGGWDCFVVPSAQSQDGAHADCARTGAKILLYKATAARTPRSYVIAGDLYGVAATSVNRAWAVGNTNSGKTLTVHWNGSAWKRVPSPSLLDYASLSGVVATSASNAWAVGSAITNAGASQTLILHWDGTTWTQVPSPSPGPHAFLSGVAATSTSDAWAVGSASSGTPLILHWNGTAWTQVPSPSSEGDLEAVAATSTSNAWAVGFAGSPGGAGIEGTNTPLILHWNGTSWTQVPSHLAPGLGNLRGVTATSAGTAWAVGCSGCLAEGAGDPLIERWNGSVWSRVPGPSPDTMDGLWGVTATSPTNGWTVGTGTTTGIVHWNGTSWKRVPSPHSGESEDHIYGVAATSTLNAWAVGVHEGTVYETLILHWNGTAWK